VSCVVTVYELVCRNQVDVIRQIEKLWGIYGIEIKEDPEDDFPEFDYYRKMMREKPRPGGR
jgi:hypothetical protein